MSIQGVTFDLQPLTAAFDGALHAYLLTDGVLSGCEVTYSGYDIYVSPGYFIAAGRLVYIPERTRIFGASIFTSASIQIKFVIDLNNTASATEFTQGQFTTAWVSTSSGDTFPALVQEDINGSTGRKYEVDFARATTDASRLLTSATRTLGAAELRLAASGGGGTGADGREIELRKGTTAIEWRYVGDTTWQTLVPLADITGPQGPQGARGATGAQGPAGQGIPAGGATGQVLVKRSSTDYDTNWATPTGGGTGGGTPDAHASTHASGGSDPITPAAIGAATSTHNHTGTYAPVNHAATATTYGKATSTSYGHVKLSTATNSTSGLSDGTAATPSAVKAAYDLAAGKADADHNHDDRYALIDHTHGGSGGSVEYVTITVPASGWTAADGSYTQQVAVTGVVNTDYITAKYTSNAISIAERAADHAAYCCITDGMPLNGHVLLTCLHTQPTRDINIILRTEHGGTTGYMVMTGQAASSAGAKTASGSVSTSVQTITVAGLGFRPSMVTFIGSSGKTTVTSGYGTDTGSATIARYADASGPGNVGTFSPVDDGFTLTVQGADAKTLSVSWYAVGS